MRRVDDETRQYALKKRLDKLEGDKLFDELVYGISGPGDGEDDLGGASGAGGFGQAGGAAADGGEEWVQEEEEESDDDIDEDDESGGDEDEGEEDGEVKDK